MRFEPRLVRPDEPEDDLELPADLADLADQLSADAQYLAARYPAETQSSAAAEPEWGRQLVRAPRWPCCFSASACQAHNYRAERDREVAEHPARHHAGERPASRAGRRRRAGQLGSATAGFERRPARRRARLARGAAARRSQSVDFDASRPDTISMTQLRSFIAAIVLCGLVARAHGPWHGEELQSEAAAARLTKATVTVRMLSAKRGTPTPGPPENRAGPKTPRQPRKTQRPTAPRGARNRPPHRPRNRDGLLRNLCRPRPDRHVCRRPGACRTRRPAVSHSLANGEQAHAARYGSRGPLFGSAAAGNPGPGRAVSVAADKASQVGSSRCSGCGRRSRTTVRVAGHCRRRRSIAGHKRAAAAVGVRRAHHRNIERRRDCRRQGRLLGIVAATPLPGQAGGWTYAVPAGISNA